MIKNKFKMSTVFLVTGCAGFIGSNITEHLLSKGYKVRGLDNLSTGKKKNIINFLENDNFDFIEGDIRNLDICKKATLGVDYVLHQAALGSVPRSIKDPETSHDVNVNGFLNMLMASKQNCIKRFVYASSSSVYGDDIRLPKLEGNEGNPISPYALTKHINEKYAMLFNNLFNLPTIGLRYFNVFGKRQDTESIYSAVIPIFVKKLLKNEAPTINGDGNFSRDFTFIDNVIQANIKACLSSENSFGKSFNIAFGETVTLNQLFAEISKLLNVNIKPKIGPFRTGDVPHSKADIKNAKEFLNYNPKYSFYEGIKITIDWYKNNL